MRVAEFDGFAFPKELAGLPRTFKADYKIPGAGFSVSYGKHGETWGDIYVYDRQLDLTSGAPLSLAKKEIETAIDDMHTLIRAGAYQSVVLQQQSVSGPFAKAHLTITQAGIARDSFIFVTVNKNRFVKIRFTTSAGSTANRTAEAFVRAFSHTISASQKKRAP
jgi:hypothetical protein